MKAWQIPRRTFLKGVGGSILLPSLDIMYPNEAAALEMPPRFAAFFMSLGIYGLGYDPSRPGASRYFYAEPQSADGLGAWKPKLVSRPVSFFIHSQIFLLP